MRTVQRGSVLGLIRFETQSSLCAQVHKKVAFRLHEMSLNKVNTGIKNDDGRKGLVNAVKLHK